MTLTAVHLKVPEGDVAFVEELPGANTPGATLEDGRENLALTIDLVLAANRELSEREIAGPRRHASLGRSPRHAARRPDRAFK